MAVKEIRFNDGAAYERMMGVWTQLAGNIFLDWLAPAQGLKWIDVGCGNGAFTELLVNRVAPTAIDGIDPSADQLAFARARPAVKMAKFHQGDAMALPFPAAGFDAAVMALVIFFVPDPAKGVAELARVAKPGGSVSAYAWDVVGHGLPMAAIQTEMRAMGIDPPLPPSFEASRVEKLRELWSGAGLEDIETREITVTRIFPSFEDYWETNILGVSLALVVAEMPSGDVEKLKTRVRAKLPMDPAGRVTPSGRANAVKGKVR